MPEEMDDLPKAVSDALDALNKVISEQKPWSYSPTNTRVEMPES
jgi:hypothetical protein